MIQRITLILLTPFIRIVVCFGLWRAARRNRRDNTYTLAELQAFHELLTKNRKS